MNKLRDKAWLEEVGYWRHAFHWIRIIILSITYLSVCLSISLSSSPSPFLSLHFLPSHPTYLSSLPLSSSFFPPFSSSLSLFLSPSCYDISSFLAIPFYTVVILCCRPNWNQASRLIIDWNLCNNPLFL